LNRLILGIVFGIGIATLLAAAGVDWPGVATTSAESVEVTGHVSNASDYAPRGPLIAHTPVPHPAILAAGQLFVSLYVLIAQQRPREALAA
jgi:hypothetical protein